MTIKSCANGAVNYPTCTPPKYIYICNGAYGVSDDAAAAAYGYTIAHFLDAKRSEGNDGAYYMTVDFDPNVIYFNGTDLGSQSGSGIRWQDGWGGDQMGRMNCRFDGH